MYAGVWLTAIIETISAALGAQVAPKGLLHFFYISLFSVVGADSLKMSTMALLLVLFVIIVLIIQGRRHGFEIGGKGLPFPPLSSSLSSPFLPFSSPFPLPSLFYPPLSSFLFPALPLP